MPFVQGKCESCGGILAVDPSLKAANCPFCGTAYVVQDSINYYNTTIKVESMHADVVNVSDESTSEGRIKAADAYMRLHKYEQAELDYKKATELTPHNYKGWLGLIEAHTRNYKKRIKSKKELRVLADYAKSVKTFAPDDICANLLQKYETYINEETDKNNIDINIYNNAIAEQSAVWNQLDTQEKSLNEKSQQNYARICQLKIKIDQYKKSNGFKLELIWTLVLLGFGVVFLALYLILGIIHILAAGIPGFLLIFGAIRQSSREKEYNDLSSEQNMIQIEIYDTKGRKNSVYKAIQANQRELLAYD